MTTRIASVSQRESTSSELERFVWRTVGVAKRCSDKSRWIVEGIWCGCSCVLFDSGVEQLMGELAGE